MFQNLMQKFESNLARMLFRLEPTANPISTPSNVTEGRGDVIEPNNPATSDLPNVMNPIGNTQPIVHHQSLGRNDPCWCGSGKKFKKCHYPQLN